jgi:hypothetical protein
MVSTASPSAQRPALASSLWWRNSPANRPALRIGLLLDGPELPNVFARVVEDIQASNFARIELAIYRKSPTLPPRPRANTVTRIFRRFFDANL